MRVSSFFKAASLGLVLVFAGCTFGLGQYAVESSNPLEPDPTTEAGAPGVDGRAPDTKDAGADADDEDSAAPVGGPCADGKKRACSTPDGDAGAICTGEQQCIQSTWGPCQVDRKCPATWGVKTATYCKNTDAIGNSPAPKWTSSQVVGADIVLWSIDRTLPFDTYGQSDRFCFIPKQAGNCWTTSIPAVEVICTGGQKKLSGDDFGAGARNRVYCIDDSGPSCRVVDKHGAPWTAGATECERWFEQVAFVVEATPRCAAW